jgi:hypothetical protein
VLDIRTDIFRLRPVDAFCEPSEVRTQWFLAQLTVLAKLVVPRNSACQMGATHMELTRPRHFS